MSQSNILKKNLKNKENLENVAQKLSPINIETAYK